MKVAIFFNFSYDWRTRCISSCDAFFTSFMSFKKRSASSPKSIGVSLMGLAIVRVLLSLMICFCKCTYFSLLAKSGGERIGADALLSFRTGPSSGPGAVVVPGRIPAGGQAFAVLLLFEIYSACRIFCTQSKKICKHCRFFYGACRLCRMGCEASCAVCMRIARQRGGVGPAAVPTGMRRQPFAVPPQCGATGPLQDQQRQAPSRCHCGTAGPASRPVRAYFIRKRRMACMACCRVCTSVMHSKGNPVAMTR